MICNRQNKLVERLGRKLRWYWCATKMQQINKRENLDLIQVQQLEILLKQNCFDQKLHFTLFYESIKASPLPKKSKCSQNLRSTVCYRFTPLQLLSSPVVCLTDEIRTWQYLSKLNAIWKKPWKRLSEVNWRSYLLKWHKRHTQHWNDRKEIGSEK